MPPLGGGVGGGGGPSRDHLFPVSGGPSGLEGYHDSFLFSGQPTPGLHPPTRFHRGFSTDVYWSLGGSGKKPRLRGWSAASLSVDDRSFHTSVRSQASDGAWWHDYQTTTGDQLVLGVLIDIESRIAITLEGDRATGHIGFSGLGYGAELTATVSGGAVTGLAVAKPGAGYHPAAGWTVEFSGGSGAKAELTIAGGKVTAAKLLEGGSGYGGTVTARPLPPTHLTPRVSALHIWG